MTEEKKATKLEKSVQTVLLSLITGALILMGGMIFGTWQDVSLIKFQIEELTKAQNTFLPRSEADGRSKMRDLEYEELKGRVSALEGRKH